MSVSTIEGHLAHFIGIGELDIHQLVTHEKFTAISEYFIENNTRSIGGAKTVLGDTVTFGELRYVLNHLETLK